MCSLRRFFSTFSLFIFRDFRDRQLLQFFFILVLHSVASCCGTSPYHHLLPRNRFGDKSDGAVLKGCGYGPNCFSTTGDPEATWDREHLIMSKQSPKTGNERERGIQMASPHTVLLGSWDLSRCAYCMSWAVCGGTSFWAGSPDHNLAAALENSSEEHPSRCFCGSWSSSWSLSTRPAQENAGNIRKCVSILRNMPLWRTR